MNKRTEELMRLLKAEEKIETYLEENSGEMLDMPVHAYLKRMLVKYGVEKAGVINASGLNQIYAYQIFAGTKMPSRDKLIALIFGFPLKLEDAQRLLKLARVSELYPRSRRDSILLFGLHQGLNVQEMDDLLFECGEDTLLSL